MCRSRRRLPFPLALLAASALMASCTLRPEPRFVPAMPTVTPVPAVAGPTTEEIRARATAQLARDDFAGATRTLRGLPGDQRDAIARELAATIAREDPARAARFALALPPGVAQEESLAAAARVMAGRDREAAAAWAFGLPSQRARYVALAAIAAELVQRDPPAGLRWVQSLPERDARTELLRIAASQWARRQPDEALAWANRLAGQVRDDVVASIGFELAQTAPERAVAVAGTLPPARDRWLLLTEIAQTWMARDPKAAEAWVRSLGPGPAQDAALAGFAAATGPIHTRRDDRFAGAASRPGRVGGGSFGLARDDALRREFERRMRESPASAAQWLSAQPGPDVTDDMLRQLAREWLRQDPRSAETWFEQNVPSAARREQIWREAAP